MIEWTQLSENSFVAKVWTGQVVGRVFRDYGSADQSFTWQLSVLNDVTIGNKQLKTKGACKTKKAAKAALIRTWFQWCSRMGLQPVSPNHRF